jgi:transcriptional regulator with XRE-family HTH domain
MVGVIADSGGDRKLKMRAADKASEDWEDGWRVVFGPEGEGTATTTLSFSAGMTIRQRRSELGMSQADLARDANIDARQIRRYEAGEQQPLFSVAVAIAAALRIPVADLAGAPSHRVKLSGEWWASWQTFRDGVEKIATQKVEMQQEGN